MYQVTNFRGLEAEHSVKLECVHVPAGTLMYTYSDWEMTIRIPACISCYATYRDQFLLVGNLPYVWYDEKGTIRCANASQTDQPWPILPEGPIIFGVQ